MTKFSEGTSENFGRAIVNTELFETIMPIMYSRRLTCDSWVSFHAVMTVLLQ